MKHGSFMANVVAVLLVSTLVTLPTPLSAQEGTGIVAEITELLTQYEKIWNSQDFPRLRELWDTDDPEPYYVPEEIEEPLIGWPALNRYWSPPRPGGKSMLEAFRWGFSNVRARLLAPDLALSIFDHRYEMKLRGERNKPSAGFDRCIGIFRKKPEGWRFILYAQCPLGPETYVRALRGKIVSPDFEDFRKKIQEKEKE